MARTSLPPLACLALALGVVGSVAADAAAAGTRLSLAGGLDPSPTPVDLTAAVERPAADAVRGCPGYMAAEPDLTVALGEPAFPLHVYAGGETLAGLIVVGPDGIFRCVGADRAATAGLAVEPLQPGDYAVFPLGAEPGASEVRILLAEYPLDQDELARALGRQDGELVAEAAPEFGTHGLDAGSDALLSVPVALAGGVSAGIAGPSCHGQIEPSRPDVVLRLAATEPRIAIRVRSAVDTTLVVRAPDGTILCDDDTFGLDPALVLEPAQAGDWAVWAGVYSGTGGQAATVEIGRGTGDDAVAGGLAHEADPEAGRHALDGSDPLSVEIDLAASTPASDFSSTCDGLIEPSRPDAVIRLAEPAEALHLRVRSASDTTLVVRSPDGALVCDDDTYGLDPAVEAAPAAAGDYAVWVGTFHGGGGGTATLEAAFEAEAVGGEQAAFDLGIEQNPLVGRTLGSADEALDILLEAGLGEVLRFDRREARGDEGFVLEGVTLYDASDPLAVVRIERVAVSELDLQGLATEAGPDRFAFRIEGIDLSGLAALGAMEGMDLSRVAADAKLSLASSLLPAEGEGMRDLALEIDLERQFAIRLGGRFDIGGPGEARVALEDAATREVSAEFENRGFLGHMIRAQAVEAGMEPHELAAMMAATIAEAFAPIVPGSPQARLVEAAAEALAAVDQRGVIRLRLSADEPRDLETLFEELQAAEGPEASERFRVDLSYEPMP